MDDCVLLPESLSRREGVLRFLRLKSTTGVRVMVLTALDTIGEKVELLNFGANDYLVKPYNHDELLARVAVQLRVHPTDVLSIGDLELSPLKRLVTCNGKDLRFGPTEFEILALLMRYPGKVYSREYIHQMVWRAEIPSNSNVVDVHLANIRGKLRDAGLYGYLRTVRGVGYGLKT
ncbi:response regulator transcription factor (plasmid) [Deinococcus radiomollis]